MRVRCDRVDVTESLNSILGIVPANSPKPILADFFLSTESGSLVAEATDLDISGKVVIQKVEIVEEGQIAVPSQRLISILKEVPEESINIRNRESTHGAVIDSEGFEFQILGHDPTEFPTVTEPETTNAFSLVREAFHDSLKRVLVATSSDETRYQLNGVFLEFGRDRLTLTATDGKRLTHDTLRIENPDEQQISAILPNQTVGVFLKILAANGPQDETVTLSLSETNVTLRVRDNRVSSNLIEGIYPNYRSIFPPEPKLRVTCRRALLLSAARSASLTTDKQTHTVVFKFSPDVLVLEAKAQDIGESRIEIPVQANGDPMEICFNPVYFIDGLRTFEEDEVTLELTDPGKPVILKGTQSYRHMVMPLVQK